ncbi:MAG: lipocalin family protein [Myxococcota bacterium]
MTTPKNLEPVSNFEIDRYLGTWYEIARLDHSFERGLIDVTAEYRSREDGGVDVINRGRDSESGEWNEALGKAYLAGDEGSGMLKVSFFGPFYGGYNVIALDQDDYQWSLVAGPNRAYLWILSRTPKLSPKTKNQLLRFAEERNFAIDELIWVEQQAD